MDDKTINYSMDMVNEVETKTLLKEVYRILEEKGYNAYDQLVGYLISGDPSYIPRDNELRNKIKNIKRDILLETIIRGFLENE